MVLPDPSSSSKKTKSTIRAPLNFNTKHILRQPSSKSHKGRLNRFTAGFSKHRKSSIWRKRWRSSSLRKKAWQPSPSSRSSSSPTRSCSKQYQCKTQHAMPPYSIHRDKIRRNDLKVYTLTPKDEARKSSISDNWKSFTKSKCIHRRTRFLNSLPSSSQSTLRSITELQLSQSRVKSSRTTKSSKSSQNCRKKMPHRVRNKASRTSTCN